MPLIRKDLASPNPSSTGDLSTMLRSGDVGDRWNAARSMGGAAESVRALGEALDLETDPRVREAILTSLARTGTPRCVDYVLPHIRANDAGLRTAALDALRAMPAAVGSRMPELLSDADLDVRVLSCELARCLPAQDASRLMRKVLEEDGNVNVCAAATDVLAEIGDQASLMALSQCAARFPNERFLGFAIKAAMDRIGRQAKPIS